MRLIEPEQITKMLSDLYISEDAVNMTGERQGLWVRFRTIEKAVSEIPTIDAVEVVCCEDCRYRNTWDNQRFDPQYYRCGMGVKFRDYGYVREDDYCPLGKRREESEVEE